MKSFFPSLNSLIRFYFEGFSEMSSWGKNVWLVIIIKLFIILVILRLFFFQDFLGSRYKNEKQKSDYVRSQIINPPYLYDSKH